MRQTEGKVTHFFAALGTCGTITGAGRFLKSRRGSKVKVHGVHPPKVHDIPGVRSIEQLKLTEHFHPEEYDELAEVTNEEAFDMCRRLNQEESLQAGPSSGMQVVGALRLMADEPGNIGVVIFCDSIFKYSSSVTKHCPALFPELASQPNFEPAELSAIKSIMEVTNKGPDSLDGEPLKAFLDQHDPVILDVRSLEDFQSKLRPLGARHAALPALTGQDAQKEELTQVIDAPGAVQRKRKTAAEEGEGRAAKKPRFEERVKASVPVLPQDKQAPVLLV